MIELLIGAIVIVIVIMYILPQGQVPPKVLLASDPTPAVDPSSAILQAFSQAISPFLTANVYNTSLVLASPVKLNFSKYFSKLEVVSPIGAITLLVSVWGQLKQFKLSGIKFTSLGSINGMQQIQASINSFSASGSIGTVGSDHTWFKIKAYGPNESCDVNGFPNTNDVSHCGSHTFSADLNIVPSKMPEVLIGTLNIPWVPSICPEIDFDRAFWDISRAGTVLDQSIFAPNVGVENLSDLTFTTILGNKVKLPSSTVNSNIEEGIHDIQFMSTLFPSLGKSIGSILSKNTSLINAIGSQVISSSTNRMAPVSQASSVCG